MVQIQGHSRHPAPFTIRPLWSPGLITVVPNSSSLILFHCSGGGGGLPSGSVKSNCEQLRKLAGKIAGNCSVVTKPPAASTSNTSELGPRGRSKHTGWTSKKQLRKICGKPLKIAGNCEKWRKCEKARKIADLRPPPPYAAHTTPNGTPRPPQLAYHLGLDPTPSCRPQSPPTPHPPPQQARPAHTR